MTKPKAWKRLPQMHKAAKGNAPVSIAKHIRHGRSVNKRTRHGDTPLHEAAWAGARRAVVALIKGGADVNLSNDGGRTPLHISALSAQKKRDSKLIFDLLVKHGADVTVKDNKGKTPLDYLKAASKRTTKSTRPKSTEKLQPTVVEKPPFSAQEESASSQPASLKRRGNARPRIVNPEERAQVERAAVGTVTAFYEARGFAVKSVEAENKGWDLEIRQGRKILHRVEVKGNKGGSILVELTPNEYEKSGAARFRLAVVRNALRPAPVCAIYERDGKGWIRADGEDGGNDKSAPKRLSMTERVSALVRAD